LAPPQFGNLDIRIDAAVLGFLFLISSLTGLLFGTMPAIEAFRQDPAEWLKQTGGRFAGRVRSHARNLLVVAEISLAMVLLTGAGLMINSFLRLQGVQLGFNPHGVLKAEIFLGGTKYWNSIGDDMKRVTPESDRFFERLLEQMQQLPGVVSAGIGAMESYYPRAFHIVGRAVPAPEDRFRADYLEVSPGYFRTLEIPLLRGRVISEDDREQNPWVLVVSEAFAHRYFPGEDPVGRLIQMSASRRGASRSIEESRPREIVGVVGDAWYSGPQSERPLVVYGSYRQHVSDYPAASYASHLANRLLIRTSGAPGGFALAVQRAVAELDKDQVPYDIAPLEQTIAEFGKPQRFWLQLLGIFGGLALFLAMVGIHGVMSHSISQRTHEIGVRIVSGAQRSDILKLVVGHGCILASIGIAIGAGGSLGLTRLVETYLYDVKPTDPLTFVAVTLVLLTVALGASYIPARKATRIEPLSALRHD
jgi:putative ABC transport system permease protein